MAFVLLAVLLAGCKGRRASASHRGSEAPVKVFLPPAPDLDRPRPPAQRRDGSLTVRGVLEHKTRLTGEAMTLRAVVYDVKLCGEQDERFCPLPSHAILVDDLGDPLHRVTVVGARLKEIPGMKRGNVVTITGRIDTVSPGGRLVSLEGLVVLPPPDPPPEPEGEGDATAGASEQPAAAKKPTRRPRRRRARHHPIEIRF